MTLLVALVASYLIGSIPFGLILARTRGIDIRKHGSGNIGATNVWRTVGPAYGAAVLALDALKGSAAVILGRQAGIEEAELLTGMAALFGHAFPIYIGFKGGKIMATGAGVMLTLTPLATLLAIAVFAVVVFISRFVSLGSIAAAVSLPFLLVAFHYSGKYLAFGVLVGLFAILKHLPNIKRILAGTESKFKFRR